MSKQDLREAMSAINDFAEANYKKSFALEIVAEYTSLYMNYLRIAEKMWENGEDILIEHHESNLNEGPEFDEMLEWEKKMVASIEASLIDTGVPEQN